MVDYHLSRQKFGDFCVFLNNNTLPNWCALRLMAWWFDEPGNDSLFKKVFSHLFFNAMIHSIETLVRRFITTDGRNVQYTFKVVFTYQLKGSHLAHSQSQSLAVVSLMCQWPCWPESYDDDTPGWQESEPMCVRFLRSWTTMAKLMANTAFIMRNDARFNRQKTLFNSHVSYREVHCAYFLASCLVNDFLVSVCKIGNDQLGPPLVRCSDLHLRMKKRIWSWYIILRYIKT